MVPTDLDSIIFYSVSENCRTNILKFEEKIRYVRIDYKTKKIMVSSQNKISILNNGVVEEQYAPPFENFHYIFPLYGIYFITTYSGVLYWSSSPKFQKYSSYPLFTQKPFQLVCRNSYLLAYSSF